MEKDKKLLVTEIASTDHRAEDLLAKSRILIERTKHDLKRANESIQKQLTEASHPILDKR